MSHWQLGEKIDCTGQGRSRETGEKAIAIIKANKSGLGPSDSGRDSEK